jgi:hypothetical protein
MRITEGHREPALPRIRLKTLEIIFETMISGPTKIVKSGIGAFEILRTLHLSYDILDFLSILFFHPTSVIELF